MVHAGMIWRGVPILACNVPAREKAANCFALPGDEECRAALDLVEKGFELTLRLTLIDFGL